MISLEICYCFRNYQKGKDTCEKDKEDNWFNPFSHTESFYRKRRKKAKQRAWKQEKQDDMIVNQRIDFLCFLTIVGVEIRVRLVCLIIFRKWKPNLIWSFLFFTIERWYNEIWKLEVWVLHEIRKTSFFKLFDPDPLPPFVSIGIDSSLLDNECLSHPKRA